MKMRAISDADLLNDEIYTPLMEMILASKCENGLFKQALVLILENQRLIAGTIEILKRVKYDS